jgi:hypothetical protein
MADFLKKHWLSILISFISLLGGADAVAGIRAGKSPTNLTVIPSILAAVGGSGFLGLRWLNSRTVVARPSRQRVPEDVLSQLEDLFGVAESPDVSPEHAGHLADVAAALLLGHYRRAQQDRMDANPNLIQVSIPSLTIPQTEPTPDAIAVPVQAVPESAPAPKSSRAKK